MQSIAPTLLILAAGMGRRHGGPQQPDPMGPHGETLLDFSVYDAAKAGFSRVVFVIRRDIEESFRKTIGKRYQNHIQVDYVFQDLTDLPDGFACPKERTKPWGTGHAILAARNAISGPFAVINADDFYGADAYAVIARYFNSCSASGAAPNALVAYRLDRTLSEHGSVNRGICESTPAGSLISVQEVTAITRQANGQISGLAPSGQSISIDAAAPVSMNFWGFDASVFQALETAFNRFLLALPDPAKGEFYIPSFVDEQIRLAGTPCHLLSTDASWFGVTYPADKPFVQAQILRLVESGIYPSPLYPDK